MLDSKGCDQQYKVQLKNSHQWFTPGICTQISTYLGLDDGTGCALSKSAGNIMWE